MHRDMDEWSLALLSCKVSLRGCAAGEAIKRKGDSSECAYIVLGGSCKVRECSLVDSHRRCMIVIHLLLLSLFTHRS